MQRQLDRNSGKAARRSATLFISLFAQSIQSNDATEMIFHKLLQIPREPKPATPRVYNCMSQIDHIYLNCAQTLLLLLPNE